MRTVVLLAMAAAGTAMAQDDASAHTRRIVLPLPKAAVSDSAPANSDERTGVSRPPADEVLSPSEEAGRAALAALNRQLARASAAPAPKAVKHTVTASAAPAPANVVAINAAAAPVSAVVAPATTTTSAPVAPQPAAPQPVMTASVVPAPPVNEMAAAAVNTYSNGSAAPSPVGMMRNFDSTAPAEESLHVMVGRSIFVDTKHRLTRVYVTDPAVLNSYTSSPNQIVVTALKAGQSTVIVWDEAGQSQAYLISADMNVDALQHALHEAFPVSNVQAQGDQDRVILTGFVGTQADADAAARMAQQYSKQVSNSLVINSSRVKQVQLKVRIIEVDRSKLTQFGFNFFSTGGKNLASTTTQAFNSTISGGGSTGNSVTVTNPLNFMFYSSQFNVGATLQDLANMNVLQILAEPTITAMSGQKASFLAGGEFPFPVVQAGGTSGTPTVTVEFRPYGVKLDFTPRVNPDGTVDLKVAPEVSALDYSNAVNIAGYTIPALSTRKADTQLVLQDGQSFAISGLLDQRITDSFSHTPGFSSIPIIGELFKSKTLNHSNTELIVMVTPTIVDPTAPNAAPALPEPQRAVPMMDPKKFDTKISRHEKQQ